MTEPLYVIGHQNPDADAIGAAIGYAWLLAERDGGPVRAARAGAPNAQTVWALTRAGLEPPVLLRDAAPRFERIARDVPTVRAAEPLLRAWSIANAHGTGAPAVDEGGRPLGLVTGASVFRYLSRRLEGGAELDDLTLASALGRPCEEALERDVPRFERSSRVRDGRPRAQREGRSDFLVVDGDGSYSGVCHIREILDPPRTRLVLVDHNEPGQAVPGVEEAELLEVLDHHRLGNLSTHLPIAFHVEPVGSSSTLVCERIVRARLAPPPGVAVALLAGLLSDTLVLRSPTTTARDEEAARRLEEWALVDGRLGAPSFRLFGDALLAAGAGLASRSADELVSTDLKVYPSAQGAFAVAQVEVTSFLDLEQPDRVPAIAAALAALAERRGLRFALLMVTDVVRGTSRLVAAGAAHLLDQLPFDRLADETLEAEGLVSRKKQLLPLLLELAG